MLAVGAGHLYGTSLPVGGTGSHTVVTGHRGLVKSLMFTRLDELHDGDFMYIKVMDETLGYEVDRISVIEHYSSYGSAFDLLEIQFPDGEIRGFLKAETAFTLIQRIREKEHEKKKETEDGN